MSGICGVFLEKDCFDDLFYLTDYHSHLGAIYGGMSVNGKVIRKSIKNITQGGFKEKLSDERVKLHGKSGIGIVSDQDAQPVTLKSKLGYFSLGVAGRVTNLEEIASRMEASGQSFSEFNTRGREEDSFSRNTTEVIAKLIIQGNNFSSGVQNVFNEIEGSLSMIILGEQGVYAVRDKRGTTPLFLGKKGANYAIGMEDFALNTLGFTVERMLLPGEFIRVSESGIKQKLAGDETNSKFCCFYFMYTGFPASSYYQRNVQEVRIENGKLMTSKEDCDFDIVFGVPDSGKFHGLGFAEGSNKPFRECLMKYGYGWGGRSFIPITQEERDFYGKMKMVPVPRLIEGKRIIVVDDSLVRGTQLAQTTNTKLWVYKPKEVHARIACPPLMFGCAYLNSTRTEELSSRISIRKIEGKDLNDVDAYLDPESSQYQRMVEMIRKEKNFTSLRYQTLEGMIKAIGLPEDRLCTYCWNGKR